MSLLSILIWEDGSDAEKARACLSEIARLSVGDLRVPGLAAASQTFALLAIADAVSESGLGLAAIVAAREGVEIPDGSDAT